MIEDIKLLLGSSIVDCEIDDKTIDACIKLANGRYSRHTTPFHEHQKQAWIFEYALAQSKLILGEARSKFSIATQVSLNDVAVALRQIKRLENELN